MSKLYFFACYLGVFFLFKLSTGLLIRKLAKLWYYNYWKTNFLLTKQLNIVNWTSFSRHSDYTNQVLYPFGIGVPSCFGKILLYIWWGQTLFYKSDHFPAVKWGFLNMYAIFPHGVLIFYKMGPSVKNFILLGLEIQFKICKKIDWSVQDSVGW